MTAEQWTPNVGGTIRSGRRPEDWHWILSTALPDGVTVEGKLIYRDGRVRFEYLGFKPAAGEDGLADMFDLLGRLRLVEVKREWQYMVHSSPQGWLDLPVEWRAGMPDLHVPGSPGHPLAFYATWVKRYLDVCGDGEPRPMDRLVSASPGETRQSINRYLKRAEIKGLIERAGPGRAGGRMTEKCERVLDRREVER